MVSKFSWFNKPISLDLYALGPPVQKDHGSLMTVKTRDWIRPRSSHSACFAYSVSSEAKPSEEGEIHTLTHGTELPPCLYCPSPKCGCPVWGKSRSLPSNRVDLLIGKNPPRSSSNQETEIFLARHESTGTMGQLTSWGSNK